MLSYSEREGNQDIVLGYLAKQGSPGKAAHIDRLAVANVKLGQESHFRGESRPERVYARKSSTCDSFAIDVQSYSPGN